MGRITAAGPGIERVDHLRGPRRDFVHSKVMAWAGVDRAIRTVRRHRLDGPVERWRRLADQIHTEVCDRGYDADVAILTPRFQVEKTFARGEEVRG